MEETTDKIDLMTWLNFEAAITRNPRVAQSLRDSAAEIHQLRTKLKASSIRDTNEMLSALRELCRVAEVTLTTPHHLIEERMNARADLAESVRYVNSFLAQQ